MEAKRCAMCANPVDPVTAANNGRRFCSIACRRAAEHAIRRVNVLLAKLETQASHARLGYGSDPGERLKRLEAEIQFQESRLRDLLADPDDSAI